MAKKKSKTKEIKRKPIRLMTFGKERKKITKASRDIKESRRLIQEKKERIPKDIRKLGKKKFRGQKGDFLAQGILIRKKQVERGELKQKTAERELRQDKRELTTKRIGAVKEFAGKTAERVSQIAAQRLKKRAVSKRVLKRSRVTLVLKEREAAPYVPIFFKR